MPFGFNSAGEVLQRTMEQLFVGYLCAIIVEDIMVAWRDVQEHDSNLKLILDRANEVNLELNPLKCRFRVDKMGHVFISNGLKPDPFKTIAISEMPAPTYLTALQRFLGIVNYLGKFIPNFS